MITIYREGNRFRFSVGGASLLLTREEVMRLSAKIDGLLWDQESKERNERISSV